MTSLKEQKIKFVKKIEDLTTLNAREVGALMRAYGIYNLFYKHDGWIIEHNLGADLAIAFLRLTRPRDIKPEVIPMLLADASNILTITMRDWIFAKGIPEFHDDEPPARRKPMT